MGQFGTDWSYLGRIGTASPPFYRGVFSDSPYQNRAVFESASGSLRVRFDFLPKPTRTKSERGTNQSRTSPEADSNSTRRTIKDVSVSKVCVINFTNNDFKKVSHGLFVLDHRHGKPDHQLNALAVPVNADTEYMQKRAE